MGKNKPLVWSERHTLVPTQTITGAHCSDQYNTVGITVSKQLKVQTRQTDVMNKVAIGIRGQCPIYHI